ncbi:MAG: putative DNA-binding domain-containing protein [Methylobacter sp.]|uniref:DNA-binding domain-containing protein n=1 Tax=Candidatus Methylobacter titanis TaxID=3053457 RepID=A0AA43Q3N8_9GAMM|nr:putative DNA-binding domain-containing protein [Candidatus Methylobacter titanis]MDI1291198.1 putative DNA-binding domain-containing protein [Candidatus Methylobacter titanis]
MSVDFKAKQLEFAAYIRDPENNPPPADVQPQRIAMYRELFFNNIDSFLSANFPVLQTILDDQQWFQLGQDFFAKHACQSPHFSKIPEEFLDYLQNERDSSNDFPFMLELAHYEWVEMALSIAKETVSGRHQNLDNLQNQSIQLSSLAWPLAYQYPVHKISPDFLPETAPEQATFLVVYRNPDDEVNFMEITPITYRLLEIIQEHEQVLVTDCLKQVAEEMHHPNPEMIMAGGLQILKELAEKTVITVAV